MKTGLARHHDKALPPTAEVIHHVEFRVRLYTDRAVSMIEFALVLPILMILVYAGIEFGLATKAYINLTAISREIGTATFYQCASTDSSGASPNAMERCINNTVLLGNGPVASQLQNLHAEAIVQVYRWSSTPLGSPPPIHAQRIAISSYPNNPQTVARSLIKGGAPVQFFTPDDDSVGAPEMSTAAKALKAEGTLVYSEIFAEYKPIFPAFVRMVGFPNTLDGGLRVVSIF